jgi:ArsR family transcriptional regulator
MGRILAMTPIPLSPVEPAAPQRTRGCCQPVGPLLPAGRAAEQAALHRALGDPTRIQMLHLLRAASEPVCVCDLTAAIDLEQPTISHHLARLREAGLVTSHRRGLWAFYRLNPEMPAAARAAIALIP